MPRILWRPQAAMALAVALLALIPALTPRRVGAAEVSVEIVDFAFSPSAITVDVGDTVVWTNTGAAPHTSTSDGGQADAWDSGALTTGQRFSRAFSTPETFTYFCAFHPFMRASVTVRALPTPTPTPSPRATPSSTPTASAGTPAATPEPSATPTATRTATPAIPTPTPSVAPATTAAPPPASPEVVPPPSSDGGVLAAGPSQPNLPSAGTPAASTTRRPGVLAAAAALSVAGLAAMWWSRRRRA